MLTLWYYIHRDIRDEGGNRRLSQYRKKPEREKAKLNTERLANTIEN